MRLLKGAEVSEKIQQEVKADLEKRSQKGLRAPHLSVILVGSNPASEVYVSLKQKMCQKLGITSTIHRLADSATTSEVGSLIQKLNVDSSVDAILMQLPLPSGLQERELLEMIDPKKDVDCLTQQNLGKMITGTASIYPCTPSGILEMLKHYEISVEGKKAAVIGRSLIVGTPLFHMLTKANATVTLFHSKSKNTADELKKFDLVFVAIGKANHFKYSQFKPDAYVIDVGINRLETGLVGDVLDDMKENSQLAGASPVPGGVGKMTIAMLMKNTVTLANQTAK